MPATHDRPKTIPRRGSDVVNRTVAERKDNAKAKITWKQRACGSVLVVKVLARVVSLRHGRAVPVRCLFCQDARVTAVLAAVVSALMAALFVLAGYAGGTVLPGVAALVVLVVALGWAMLLRLPSPRGTSLVIVATGWSAIGVAWANEFGARPLAVFAAVLAFAVLAAFAHELVRSGSRPRLVESVAGTLSGQVVALLSAGWVLLPATAPGTAAVCVAAVTVGASRLVTGIPIPDRAAGWVSVAVGVSAGSLAAALLARDSMQACVASAVAVASVAAALDRLLAGQVPKQASVGLLAMAAAPVSSVGMVAYTVVRLL
jgi:hypothetical protein